MAGILIALIFSSELYLCDGVWTTKSCEAPGKVLEQVEDSGTDSEVALRNKKQMALHDFKMDAISAKREYGIESDTETVEKFCYKKDTSLEDCKSGVNEASDSLREKVNTERKIRARTEVKVEQEVIEKNTVVYIDNDRRRRRRKVSELPDPETVPGPRVPYIRNSK